MGLDLFWIAAIFTTVTGLVWIFEVFTLGIARYVRANRAAFANEGSEKVLALSNEPAWVDWVGKLFLYSLVPLLYLSIRKSLDFAILLSIATMATGLVALIDQFTIRRLRYRLIRLAGERFAPEDQAHEILTTEPTVIETSRSFFPVLFVVLMLRSFIAEPFQIPSGSMKPTLQIGDFIVVSKFAYGLKLPVAGDTVFEIDDPETGDMIVFKPPHEPQKTFIKRVVGVPGDTIQYDYRRKRLWLNGKEVTARYISDEIVDGERVRVFEETLGETTHRIYKAYRNTRMPGEWISPEGFTVPDGKYFVMGDNRDNSFDSRYWKFVDEQAILGKAELIWLHWPTLTSIPSFSRNGWVE